MPPPLARAQPPGRADRLAPLLDLPGVPEALASAREAVDRLLAHRVLRRQSAVVSSESALRGARASAALAGSDVPLVDLRSGRTTDPTVHGALRVTGGLGPLVAVWDQAPLQALARLHVLAAAGSVPEEKLGRPVGSPAVASRLGSLGQLLSGGTQVAATLLAAVVHGEIATLAPFGAADDLVARAAERLTLIARGVDPKAVSVPEVGHRENAEAYRTALAGYATGSAAGVAGWLRHCATAVELGAREGLAICEGVLRG